MKGIIERFIMGTLLGRCEILFFDEKESNVFYCWMSRVPREGEKIFIGRRKYGFRDIKGPVKEVTTIIGKHKSYYQVVLERRNA